MKLFIAFIFSVLCLYSSAQNTKTRRPARTPADSTVHGIPNPDFADSAVNSFQSTKEMKLTDIWFSETVSIR